MTHARRRARRSVMRRRYWSTFARYYSCTANTTLIGKIQDICDNKLGWALPFSLLGSRLMGLGQREPGIGLDRSSITWLLPVRIGSSTLRRASGRVRNDIHEPPTFFSSGACTAAMLSQDPPTDIPSPNHPSQLRAAYCVCNRHKIHTHPTRVRLVSQLVLVASIQTCPGNMPRPSQAQNLNESGGGVDSAAPPLCEKRGTGGMRLRRQAQSSDERVPDLVRRDRGLSCFGSGKTRRANNVA